MITSLKPEKNSSLRRRGDHGEVSSQCRIYSRKPTGHYLKFILYFSSLGSVENKFILSLRCFIQFAGESS